MTVKLLLTGFEPFGGETINPAQEALALVPDRIGALEIVKLILPVVFGKSIAVVRAALREHRPDAVLCIGQAGGRMEATPERVALNLNDARIPDNDKNQPVDEPIFADGPAAYFATLPVKDMVAAIRSAGLPARVSNTAGLFVCNQVMYGVLYYLAHELPHTLGGFMHVPYAPEQAARQSAPQPSMSKDDIARAISAAIGAIERHLAARR